MLSGTQPDVTSCLCGPISFAAALRQANHASPRLRNPAERPFDLISILLPCHGLLLRRSGLFGSLREPSYFPSVGFIYGDYRSSTSFPESLTHSLHVNTKHGGHRWSYVCGRGL